MQHVAARAAVDEHPLAVATHANCDRFHRGTAIGVAVAGCVVVEVTAPQAVGAVVAMGGSWRVERHVETAVAAAERALRLPMPLLLMARPFIAIVIAWPLVTRPWARVAGQG